jgi:hypothetical protein
MMKNLSFLLAALILASAVPAKAEEPAFKPNFLVQTWLVNDTTVTAAKPDFRIRRAELRFAGNVTESARWFIMADMAKTLSASDGKVLQDVGAAYMLVPGLEFVAGQFKTLTSSEGLEKTAELFLPERSIVGRSYGDRREQGAMLMYKKDKLQAGLMLSNDTGSNTQDVNSKKDLSVRLDYEVADGFRVGAFTQASDFNYSINGRTGLNARVAVGDLIFNTEGVMGTLNSAATRGAQGTLGYSVTSSIQPVVRVAAFTPDTSLSTAQEYTLGLNYYFSKHQAKVQLAYAYLNNLVGNNGTNNTAPGTSSYREGAKGSVLWLAFQAAL